MIGDCFSFMERKHFILLLAAIGAVGILDGVLKVLAIRWLTATSRVPIVPFVDLTLHKNPGVTFDIPIPMGIIAIVTVFVLLWVVDRAVMIRRSMPVASLGLAAVAVGAMNNLVDRMVSGFTTDYVMFFRTSIINISDVMIVGGVAVLLWYNQRNPHALRILTQGPPPWFYVFILRAFGSIVRFVRHGSHR